MKRRCRGKACTSEFDYAGWSAWGQWRANELKLRGGDDGKDEEDGVVHRDCENNCRFPSQCRWGTPVSNPTTAEVIVETIEADANGDAVADSAKVLKTDMVMDVHETDLDNISSDVIGVAF